MKEQNKVTYQVAKHIFSILSDHPAVVRTLLPSYEPFLFTETAVKEPLFLLEIVGNLSVEGTKIHQFSWDDAQIAIYTTDYGYCFGLVPHNCTDLFVLQATHDFSSLKVSLQSDSRVDSFVLNNFIMLAYAFATASKATILMHASVVKRENQGYLFLGVSGTGKSTHSQLWLDTIPQTALLNDDNPVVRIIEGKKIVFGTPWSGKTPCYKNESASIAAFVELQQAPSNQITSLEPLEAYVVLLASSSLMKWDQRISDGLMQTLSDLSMSVPVYKLNCLPDKAAAKLCFARVTHG